MMYAYGKGTVEGHASQEPRGRAGHQEVKHLDILHTGPDKPHAPPSSSPSAPQNTRWTSVHKAMTNPLGR